MNAESTFLLQSTRTLSRAVSVSCLYLSQRAFVKIHFFGIFRIIYSFSEVNADQYGQVVTSNVA